MPTPQPVIRIERTIPASPSEVYRAWLDPDLVRRWMAPGSFAATQVEIDARVGGHYRIWHSDSGAAAGGFESELLELVPDERIVLRWGFAGPDRASGPVFDSLLTITLAEQASGTALTLVHERLDDLAAAMPHVAQNVEAGWVDVLGQLTLLLAPSATPPRSAR